MGEFLMTVRFSISRCLLCLVLVFGLLAGCGSKEAAAPAGSEDAAPADGAKTLTIGDTTFNPA